MGTVSVNPSSSLAAYFVGSGNLHNYQNDHYTVRSAIWV